MTVEKCNRMLDETETPTDNNSSLARAAAVKYCQTLGTYFKYPGPEAQGENNDVFRRLPRRSEGPLARGPARGQWMKRRTPAQHPNRIDIFHDV